MESIQCMTKLVMLICPYALLTISAMNNLRNSFHIELTMLSMKKLSTLKCVPDPNNEFTFYQCFGITISSLSKYRKIVKILDLNNKIFIQIKTKYLTIHCYYVVVVIFVLKFCYFEYLFMAQVLPQHFKFCFRRKLIIISRISHAMRNIMMLCLCYAIGDCINLLLEKHRRWHYISTYSNK